MLLMLVNGVLFIITITTIYRSPAYTQMFRYSVLRKLLSCIRTDIILLLNTSLDTKLAALGSMIAHNYLVIWSHSNTAPLCQVQREDGESSGQQGEDPHQQHLQLRPGQGQQRPEGADGEADH